MKKCLTIREHQKVMLKMLIAFDKYCTKNKLRYFLAYGTLLGAVRHKGFIPWDDDVDIFMPRPDYEKLLSDSQISEDIDIVSNRNPHSYYHPFCASVIADKNTIMEELLISKQTGKGIFCDIFPLDGIPQAGLKLKLHLFKLRLLQSIISNGCLLKPKVSSLKGFVKYLLHMVFKNQDIARYSRYLDSLAKKYDYEDSEYVLPSVAFDGAPYKYTTLKKKYDEYVLLDFEGYKLRAPKDYKEILKACYGDYMQLPPENERSGHHGIKIYNREK